MAEGLLAREPIAHYGEFRAYLRRERQELVFEAFRKDDGRAWLLRVPVEAKSAMAGLLREVMPMVGDSRRATVGDSAVLRQVPLGPKDQLAAVVLADGEERAFALWRQEELRSGWSWTIDVVVVPLHQARGLCDLAMQVLDRFGATH
jgi:hypothetical protein